MLKPIRKVRLKTVGLGIRFARGIMARAAVIGGYDYDNMSESELVFAIGAARGRDDLMSVLELLDELLDLMSRGFDRRSNALMVRIINNIGIILNSNGFSREYSDTLNLYNKIIAAIDAKSVNGDISGYHNEIQSLLFDLRSESAKQASGQRGSPRFVGIKAINTFKTVSERGILSLNTLNSGLLEIMARNPELQKMLKLDEGFMEMSLKNIDSLRRRTERVMSVQRFFDALTAEQIKLLERFVVSEDLFSEIREKRAEGDLKYMLETASEKSFSEFFETLKQRLREQELHSERVWFESAEGMKEFFIEAGRGEIETLIKELEKDSSHRSEVRVLSDALRIYEAETEKRGEDDGRLEELYKTAELALKQRLAEESFSEERFIASLKDSHELKRFFAEYAWENYRSPETEKRFFEYANSTRASEMSAEITKESFAEFLISSGELSRIFSESVKNAFLNAPPGVAAAFAEYLVSTVREGDHGRYGTQLRSLAEKAEKILYYGDTNLSEKSSETFSLIYGAWNENAAHLSEIYAEFTQSDSRREEIMKLYSQLPKNSPAVLLDFMAEFLEAAAQGDGECIRLSNEFKARVQNLMTVVGEGAREYTFYDALSDLPENTLKLLLPLAGAAQGESAALESPEPAITAAFAEYLSHTVRGDSSAHYSESLHALAERLEGVFRDERQDIDIRESSAEALMLLRDQWNSDPNTLSELYTRFTEFAEKKFEHMQAFDHGTDRVEVSELLKESKKLFEQSVITENELHENTPELIFNNRGENTLITKTSVFSEKTSEKALYRELAELRVLLPSISNRSERRAYNIARAGERIVTDKKLYNVLKLFGGDAEILENRSENRIVPDSFSLTLAPRELFVTWESGSVTQFSRATAERLNNRANGFFKRRSSAALTLSERISENYSAENQHLDYNTATELFYTDEYFDEYFDNGGRGDTQVNYAIPAATTSEPGEVSEKLGTIRGAIDSINTEIALIKQREEEIGREFVTKSEHKIFEKELKSSIERDIYLAGKRHGKF